MDFQCPMSVFSLSMTRACVSSCIQTRNPMYEETTYRGTALIHYSFALPLYTTTSKMKYAAIATIAISTIACATAFTSRKPAFTRASVAVNMSSADFINAEIAAHDVVIFSKSYCPFCTKTKNLFEDLNVDATVYELNKMDDGADIQDALKDLTGQGTVPNVFVKGENIGGNDDCQNAAKEGTLKEKLGL